MGDKQSGLEDFRSSGLRSAEITGSTSAKRLPESHAKFVILKARVTNAGMIYVGGPYVSVPDGTEDWSTGYELEPGAATPWIPVSNLNDLWMICDNATDNLTALVIPG